MNQYLSHHHYPPSRKICGLGTSVGSPKTQVDRQLSNDSILGIADGTPTGEPASVGNSAQPQRLGSAGTRQRNKLSDEALQAAIR